MAAERGHAGAAKALGQMYFMGAGVAQDEDAAAYWFTAAAEMGDEESAIDLSNLMVARGNESEFLEQTRHWFQHGAQNGNQTAAFNYGICLIEGIGGEADEAEGARWLCRAADTLPVAQYWYGKLLDEGRGGPRAPEDARLWYERAARAGVAEACANLGEMLVNGRGGPRDHARAAALFREAADKDHVGAMFALGALHDGGHDIAADRSLARSWFQKAADRGHAGAKAVLDRYIMRESDGRLDGAGTGGDPESTPMVVIEDASADSNVLANEGQSDEKSVNVTMARPQHTEHERRHP
jgi:TPR repeat protein